MPSDSDRSSPKVLLFDKSRKGGKKSEEVSYNLFDFVLSADVLF
jgi:hypothetical protein